MANPGAIVEQFRSVGVALAELPSDVETYRGLSETELLAVNEALAASERAQAARRALVAGELAHRSRPALGSQGLARRSGHRTVEKFLQRTAGITGGQAVTAVRAGAIMTDLADEGRVDELTGEVLSPAKPWLRALAPALASGALSTAAAEVIELGLGAPNSAVTCAQLEGAVRVLIAEAIAGVDPDALRRRVRDARDELDLAGVAIREDELRATRNLIHFEKTNGCGRAIWDMDPETYAAFKDIYDRSTSPKRGGVRFVNSDDAAKSAAITSDERTPGQLASDAFVQLLGLGADADPQALLGSGAPVIRITVAEQALEDGVGVARIDGQSVAVSIPTAQRLLCGATSIRSGFDPAGNVLDLEKEDRLFSRRQREILAAKFGGCMDPDCDRPPSWCEAHHILQWKRDGGKTVIDNGILLCKHHHLKYHNEGYEIVRDNAGRYWQIRPVSRLAERVPRLMPLKSAALRDLWNAVERVRAGSVETLGSVETPGSVEKPWPLDSVFA
jgi:hypothetical protein